MLHYTTFKHATSKTWVTFVHGAGGSSSIWFKQVREFSKNFNVLLLDLRGHGKSKMKFKDAFKKDYTFDVIVDDIVAVLDKEHIKSSHFVGISLGTILIRQLGEMCPSRVDSMIMGGAIVKMNVRSQILIRFGNIFKSVVPYMWLYNFFAYIIMPKRNHKASRLLFVNEAKKLYQKEFLRWWKLTSKINPLLRLFRQIEVNIATLYIMGDEDHMFLPSIRKIAQTHRSATLHVIPNCGHVVNVDEPVIFNTRAISFIKEVSGER
ncbi:MAG: alpha/beta hydrolase [Bacteroidales bacterium]|nr:alpha/beta hydrolase [Bacteroidales bacterium]